MRKLIVELKLSADSRSVYGEILSDKIRSIEVLQFLNIDPDRGVKFFIGLFTMNDGFTLDDMRNSDNLEILDVIRADGNKYTCFVKGQAPENYLPEKKAMSRDLIWDTPTIISMDKVTVSVIGDRDNLKNFLELLKIFAKIENVIYQSAAYQERSILSCLTNRQREVILVAKKNGYYEYPRGINGDQLAQKFGISKAAVIEHLRKAESRIMSNILSGY